MFLCSPRVAGVLLLVGLSMGVGCANDDSSANRAGAAGGADNALAQKDCYVGLPTPGVTYTGYGCSGTSTSSTVSALGPKSWDDVRMTISLTLNTPPSLGVLDLETLTVQVPTADATPTWNAPLGACVATATKSAVDADFGWVYFLIDISCNLPALPATGNPGAPLDLNSFSIVTFFTQ